MTFRTTWMLKWKILVKESVTYALKLFVQWSSRIIIILFPGKKYRIVIYLCIYHHPCENHNVLKVLNFTRMNDMHLTLLIYWSIDVIMGFSFLLWLIQIKSWKDPMSPFWFLELWVGRVSRAPQTIIKIEYFFVDNCFLILTSHLLASISFGFIIWSNEQNEVEWKPQLLIL